MMTDSIAKQLFKKDLGYKYCQNYDFLFSKLKCFTVRDCHDSPMFACKLAKCPNYEHVVAAAGEDGRVLLTTKMSDSERFDVEVVAHYNAIFDISWMNGDMKFVTASGDQSAVLWDMGNGRVNYVSRFTSHPRSVKATAFAPECKNIFASGCRDGIIKVWDVRTNLPTSNRSENSISMAHFVTVAYELKQKKRFKKISSGITGLDFQDSVTVVSCSAGDPLIKFWDLRKTYSVCTREPNPVFYLPYYGSGQKGYSHLHVDHITRRLFVNGVDSTIYSFNLASLSTKPVSTYTGHINTSNYVKSCLSPDGRYLMSGSVDGHGYIWKTSSTVTKLPQMPIVKLLGHKREMTCMAWRQVGDIRIYTCGDDGKQLVWKVGSENQKRQNCQGYAQKLEYMNMTNLPQSQDSEEVLCVHRAVSCSRRPFCSVDSNDKPDTERCVKRQCQESSFSITSNLPNYVIDGTSPHAPCQPKPQSKENRDWLTKLRNKLAESNMAGNEQSASPKSSQCRAKSSPKSSSNLLRYFRVVEKPNETVVSGELKERDQQPYNKSEDRQEYGDIVVSGDGQKYGGNVVSSELKEKDQQPCGVSEDSQVFGDKRDEEEDPMPCNRSEDSRIHGCIIEEKYREPYDKSEDGHMSE